MSSRHAALAAAIALCFTGSTATASCGSAFCMVNTNWGVQGVWNVPGIRGDLRFEYIDQDQPRTGTHDVAVGEIPRHHDEVRTINRNVFATLDYGISDALGISLIVPWVDREHEHIHNHRGEALRETWNFSDLGDVRIVGRYQFATAPFDIQATRLGRNRPAGADAAAQRALEGARLGRGSGARGLGQRYVVAESRCHVCDHASGPGLRVRPVAAVPARQRRSARRGPLVRRRRQRAVLSGRSTKRSGAFGCECAMNRQRPAAFGRARVMNRRKGPPAGRPLFALQPARGTATCRAPCARGGRN